MAKKEKVARKVGADLNGGNVILSPGNRVWLEERSLFGLPEILGSAPKVRWRGNLRRYPNVT